MLHSFTCSVLVVTPHERTRRSQRKLKRRDVPEVPVTQVIELYEPHVRPVNLRHTLSVHLDVPLEVISGFPPHVIERHLGNDTVGFVGECHFTHRLEFHRTPKTPAILL